MKTLLLVLFLVAAALATGAVHADTPSATGPRITVPAHDIERGEVIGEGDLSVVAISPDRMRQGVVMNAADLVGHEARRLLHTGEPVRSEDVRMPILVSKGSTVTMTFAVPGIMLTATGRAMSEGGLGESVVVENPVSFRQVTCIVTGPGEVRAGDATLAPGTKIAANP